MLFDSKQLRQPSSTTAPSCYEPSQLFYPPPLFHSSYLQPAISEISSTVNAHSCCELQYNSLSTVNDLACKHLKEWSVLCPSYSNQCLANFVFHPLTHYYECDAFVNFLIVILSRAVQLTYYGYFVCVRAFQLMDDLLNCGKFKPNELRCVFTATAKSYEGKQGNIQKQIVLRIANKDIRTRNSLFTSKISRQVNTRNQTRKAASIKCAMLNSRSLCNKSAILHEFIVEHDLSLIAITESWLSGNSISDDQVLNDASPDGFLSLSTPRQGRKGGGLALLFKKPFQIRILADSSIPNFSSAEIVCYVIKHNKVSIVLALIYRPPNSPLNRFFDELVDLRTYLTLYGSFCIMGDFNLPIIPDSGMENCGKWLDVFSSLGLKQHVSEATHSGGHILDVVFTEHDSELIKDITVVDGISDHNAIVFTMHINTSEIKYISKPSFFRCYRKIVKEQFHSDLCAFVASPVVQLASSFKLTPHSSPELSLINVDSIINLFNSKLKEVVDKHAPMKCMRARQRPWSPWWSQVLNKHRHKLRAAERKWRQTKLTVHSEIFQKLKVTYHSEIIKAKRNHFSKMIENTRNNPRRLWTVLNNSLGRVKTKALPPHESEIQLAIDFNNHFLRKVELIHESLGQTEAPVICVDDEKLIGQQLSDWEPASMNEIAQLIKSSPRKSDVIDPLPTWLLVEHMTALLPAITTIVNLALISGMPAMFKHSIVRPLLKKQGSDETKMDNYRPVSTLPFLSKLIERVVNTRLSSYLESNKLFDPFQSAYRRFHSCETALLKVINDTFQAVDNKKISILTLLDLSAAFDTVNHSILGQVLHSLHINGLAHSWIMNYLSNRRQSVIIGNTISPSLITPHGVPQGSVLGPLLFCIYISDIGSVFKSTQLTYMSYADDLQVLASIDPLNVPTAINEIQVCTENIQKYLTARKLKMNSSKTEILFIGSKKALQTAVLPAEVTICNSSIRVSHVVRNLGFLVDSHLNFSAHVSKVNASAFCYLKIISKLRNSLSAQTTMTLVHSLVMSRINFCAPLLYGVHKKLTRQLQRVQNAAFRIIFKKKKNESISSELKQLKCLPIEKLLQYRCLCLAHKTIYSGTPGYLADHLQAYVPSRALRSSTLHLLNVPKVNTVIGARAFSTAIPHLWNDLPEEIRKIKIYQQFSHAVLKHLLE